MMLSVHSVNCFYGRLQVLRDLSINVGNESVGLFGPNGFLTPANSDAGSVPATVTTDATGSATFQITYLKAFGWWVQDTLTATVEVSGSETNAVLTWLLDVEEGESSSCHLFDSPYGDTGGACYNVP